MHSAGCEAEIVEFHEFLERWMGTDPPGTAAFERVCSALGEDFEMTTPTGEVRDAEAVERGIRNARGVHADADPPLSIRIENGRVRHVADDTCLVAYEEWQRWDDSRTGRTSSALFRASADAPNGVEWVHLHETWLDGPAHADTGVDG